MLLQSGDLQNSSGIAKEQKIKALTLTMRERCAHMRRKRDIQILSVHADKNADDIETSGEESTESATGQNGFTDPASVTATSSVSLSSEPNPSSVVSQQSTDVLSSEVPVSETHGFSSSPLLYTTIDQTSQWNTVPVQNDSETAVTDEGLIPVLAAQQAISVNLQVDVNGTLSSSTVPVVLTTTCQSVQNKSAILSDGMAVDNAVQNSQNNTAIADVSMVMDNAMQNSSLPLQSIQDVSVNNHTASNKGEPTQDIEAGNSTTGSLEVADSVQNSTFVTEPTEPSNVTVLDTDERSLSTNVSFIDTVDLQLLDNLTAVVPNLTVVHAPS